MHLATVFFYISLILFVYFCQIAEADVTCKKLVGVYNGTFSPSPLRGYENLTARYQISLDINDATSIMTTKFDHMDADSEANHLLLYSEQDDHSCYLNHPCTLNISSVNETYSLDIQADDTYTWAILGVQLNNRHFTLNEPVGRCTNQQNLKVISWFPPADPRFYKYCVCCDEYAPDASLGCPNNEWPASISTSTTASTTKSYHTRTIVEFTNNFHETITIVRTKDGGHKEKKYATLKSGGKYTDYFNGHTYTFKRNGNLTTAEFTFNVDKSYDTYELNIANGYDTPIFIHAWNDGIDIGCDESDCPDGSRGGEAHTFGQLTGGAFTIMFGGKDAVADVHRRSTNVRNQRIERKLVWLDEVPME